MSHHDDIRTFLAGELGRRLDGVSNSDSLLESGVLDSLAVMKLAAFLEGRYGITIGEDDLMPEYFDTIDAVAELVASKSGTRSA
jgi:acyl carrier protein